MEYDRGDSFPSNFANGIQFGSKSNGKLSPRSYSTPYEKRWESIFPCVGWEELLRLTTVSQNWRRICTIVQSWMINRLFFRYKCDDSIEHIENIFAKIKFMIFNVPSLYTNIVLGVFFVAHYRHSDVNEQLRQIGFTNKPGCQIS